MNATRAALIGVSLLSTQALADTYALAPISPATGLQTYVGTAFTPQNGHTITGDFPAGMPWVDISGVTPVPQPGWTYSGGVWTPPATPAPTNAQAAAALQAGGLTITSTSTPALNGVYPLDDATQSAINAVSTFVLVNPGSFPSGAAQPFFDLSGTPHVFTSTTEWQAFASAVARTVAALTLYGAGQAAAPTMTATIP